MKAIPTTFRQRSGNDRFPVQLGELSTARVTSVVQYMIKGLQFPPQHMGAIGYGQFQPLVPNDTDEHRSMNRRVVFFIKNTPPNFKKGDKDKEGKKDEAAPKEEVAVAQVAPASQSDATGLPQLTEEKSNATNPIPEPNN